MASQTKPRKIPTRQILPLLFVSRHRVLPDSSSHVLSRATNRWGFQLELQTGHDGLDRTRPQRLRGHLRRGTDGGGGRRVRARGVYLEGQGRVGSRGEHGPEGRAPGEPLRGRTACRYIMLMSDIRAIYGRAPLFTWRNRVVQRHGLIMNRFAAMVPRWCRSTAWTCAPAYWPASRKSCKKNGWQTFPLISLVGQAPHVLGAHMGCTCGDWFRLARQGGQAPHVLGPQHARGTKRNRAGHARADGLCHRYLARLQASRRSS